MILSHVIVVIAMSHVRMMTVIGRTVTYRGGQNTILIMMQRCRFIVIIITIIIIPMIGMIP